MSNLTHREKKPVIKVVNSHLDAYQSDLPSYNNAFRKVNTNFEWARKTMPTPTKLWALAYGSHGAILYNMKCQQLKDKGVLISPAGLDIQPIITNNSWIMRKPSSASKPLEECTVNDVHLVMGFDPIHKYLQDPPGKVTIHTAIYTNLAKCQVKTELDFRNIYNQIKFKADTHNDKKKLEARVPMCPHSLWNSSLYMSSYGSPWNGCVPRQTYWPIWCPSASRQAMQNSR